MLQKKLPFQQKEQSTLQNIKFFFFSFLGNKGLGYCWEQSGNRVIVPARYIGGWWNRYMGSLKV
jgi:hypothetical protein